MNDVHLSATPTGAQQFLRDFKPNPKQTLYCRRALWDELQRLPEAPPGTPAPLSGLRVSLSECLPEAVKDKDGAEYELLGILADDRPPPRLPGLLEEGMDFPLGRVQLLVGKKVKDAPPGEPQ